MKNNSDFSDYSELSEADLLKKAVEFYNDSYETDFKSCLRRNLFLSYLSENYPYIVEKALEISSNNVVKTFTNDVIDDAFRIDYLSKSELQALLLKQTKNYGIQLRNIGDTDDLRCCKVVGQSMIGAGINDGDLVIFNSNTVYHDNDIVIAEINNNIFIKRYFNDNGKIILASENPKYPNYFIPSDVTFKILGKVVKIIQSQRDGNI